MTFKAVYHPLVVKHDIPRLDQATKGRIKRAIEQKLMVHPEVFGIPLRHSREGHRKLRVGDYRIVFRLKGTILKILIIEHRSQIYKELQKRALE